MKKSLGITLRIFFITIRIRFAYYLIMNRRNLMTLHQISAIQLDLASLGVKLLNFTPWIYWIIQDFYGCWGFVGFISPMHIDDDILHWCFLLDVGYIGFFYNDFNQVSYTTSEIPFWMLDILDFFITTNLTSCITL